MNTNVLELEQPAASPSVWSAPMPPTYPAPPRPPQWVQRPVAYPHQEPGPNRGLVIAIVGFTVFALVIVTAGVLYAASAFTTGGASQRSGTLAPTMPSISAAATPATVVPNLNPVLHDATAVPAGGAGATVAPGTEIGQNTAGGCTVSFAGQLPDGRKYAITAGHCAADGSPVWLAPYEGAEDYSFAHLAQYRVWQNDTLGGFTTPAFGFAVAELSPAVTVSNATDRGRIVGTATVQPGDRVCKLGVTTGWTCGQVSMANEQQVEISIRTERGDSGGPVVVVRPDGTLALVGITVGGTGGVDRAAPIAAVLANVRAHFDSAVAVPGS